MILPAAEYSLLGMALLGGHIDLRRGVGRHRYVPLETPSLAAPAALYLAGYRLV